MFSHVMLGTNNMQAAMRFYDATFAALGYDAGVLDDRGRCFYRTKRGVFALTTPINNEPATAANGGTIGLLARTQEMADAWHAAGLENGGTSCEDPPGLRGGTGYYLAYLRDPDGNKLCVLHQP